MASLRLPAVLCTAAVFVFLSGAASAQSWSWAVTPSLIVGGGDMSVVVVDTPIGQNASVKIDIYINEQWFAGDTYPSCPAVHRIKIPVEASGGVWTVRVSAGTHQAVDGGLIL